MGRVESFPGTPIVRHFWDPFWHHRRMCGEENSFLRGTRRKVVHTVHTHNERGGTPRRGWYSVCHPPRRRVVPETAEGGGGGGGKDLALSCDRCVRSHTSELVGLFYGHRFIERGFMHHCSTEVAKTHASAGEPPRPLDFEESAAAAHMMHARHTIENRPRFYSDRIRVDGADHPVRAFSPSTTHRGKLLGRAAAQRTGARPPPPPPHDEQIRLQIRSRQKGGSGCGQGGEMEDTVWTTPQMLTAGVRGVG